ncbi:MAG: prenyltransferase/squalene oxidase repeat-containing protein [Planctomycetota bacterium]
MFVISTITFLAIFQPVPQGADPDFQKRINEAIDRGVRWLKKEQRANGTWPDGHNEKFESGVAALGFLTLTKSGVGESDPSLQRCIQFFNEYRAFEKTYSTGVLAMAWEALKRGSVDKPRAEAAAKWLMEHRDEKTKLWAYPDGDVDCSNTQYALLGLHAASRMGVDIPREFLFQTVNAIVKMQQKDGGFVYRNADEVPAGSMTTAGICALQLAARHLKSFPQYESKKSEWLAAEKLAFDWLEKHFRVDANPAGFSERGGMRVWHYYYLYGLERACELAGKQKIGKHWWYREGAEYLLSNQHADGHWRSDFTDTCFALLFLKRATSTWTPDRKTHDVDTAVSPQRNEIFKRPPEPHASVVFIKKWSLAGPFLTKKTEPLSKDEIGEASIKSVLDGTNAGASNKRWKKIELTEKETVVNLETQLQPFTNAFAYGFTILNCKKDTDAVLWLGHDDGAKAWLNGKLIYENETYGEAPGHDMYFVHIKLKAGANPFLIKVFNASYGTGFCARVANMNGAPVE